MLSDRDFNRYPAGRIMRPFSTDITGIGRIPVSDIWQIQYLVKLGKKVVLEKIQIPN